MKPLIRLLSFNVKLLTLFKLHYLLLHYGSLLSGLNCSLVFLIRKSGNKISLFFYAGFDEGGQGILQPTFAPGVGQMNGIAGSTESLGKFKIEFSATNGTEEHVKHILYSATERFGLNYKL